MVNMLGTIQVFLGRRFMDIFCRELTRLPNDGQVSISPRLLAAIENAAIEAAAKLNEEMKRD